MRSDLLARLEAASDWDLVVIGGGATGIGTALAAVRQGYRTVLLEQRDFAAATSSRSTKLIHGGLRYLRQGNISLVRESLLERGMLLDDASGLVHRLQFALPCWNSWEKLFFGAGLLAYEKLAGRWSLGRCSWHAEREWTQLVPGVQEKAARGAWSFWDGQFDDARLAIAGVQALWRGGAVPLNYVRVNSFLKRGGRVLGVRATDEETGREYEVTARAVVNATGIFSDTVRSMDSAGAASQLRFSQGAHVVLDRSFFPGTTALLIPRTEDGRLLFVIPWANHVLVGTTDVPVEAPTMDPRPQPSELEFLLRHAAHYLQHPPALQDVKSCFAGIRPLVGRQGNQHSAQLPRDHSIQVSASGLVSIVGGKWTTFRKMGEDVVRQLQKSGLFALQNSQAPRLKLELQPARRQETGTMGGEAELRESDLEYFVDHQFARTVEDVLARRSRLLFLDARAADQQAPRVAETLARKLQKNEGWQQEQVASFSRTVARFLP